MQLYLRLQNSLLCVRVSSQRFPSLFTVLVCCDIISSQIRMKTKQNKHKPHGRQNEQGQQNINNKPSNLFLGTDPGKADRNLNECKNKHESQRKQKKIEKLIISFSDAIPNPWTVMIKSLHTHVAIIAMCCSWGSEDVTSVAKFYLLGVSFHGHCVEYRLLFADCCVQVTLTYWDLAVCWVLIIAEYLGNYAWIHPGQYQHENNDQNMENDREYNEYPYIRMRRKSIHQAHTNVDNSKSSQIIFRL